jgi:hypothetical protein
VGQGWQKERGARERFSIRNLKTEIELKKRVFRKTFQDPIKSRKINWIFAKITLNDFDLFNHINTDIVNKRRFVHN